MTQHDLRKVTVRPTHRFVGRSMKTLKSLTVQQRWELIDFLCLTRMVICLVQQTKKNITGHQPQNTCKHTLTKVRCETWHQDFEKETSVEQWKRAPWLFRVYRGWKTTQLCGDYFIKHEMIGSLFKLPRFNGKYPGPRVFWRCELEVIGEDSGILHGPLFWRQCDGRQPFVQIVVG